MKMQMELAVLCFVLCWYHVMSAPDGCPECPVCKQPCECEGVSLEVSVTSVSSKIAARYVQDSTIEAEKAQMKAKDAAKAVFKASMKHKIACADAARAFHAVKSLSFIFKAVPLDTKCSHKDVLKIYSYAQAVSAAAAKASASATAIAQGMAMASADARSGALASGRASARASVCAAAGALAASEAKAGASAYIKADCNTVVKKLKTYAVTATYAQVGAKVYADASAEASAETTVYASAIASIVISLGVYADAAAKAAATAITNAKTAIAMFDTCKSKL